MPGQRPVLTRATAGRLAADHGFSMRPGSPAGCTGLELEWLVVPLDDPDRGVPFPDVEAALADIVLPASSRITFEPGGQIELSTPPLPGLEACEALATDAAELGAALAANGVGLVALGLEPGARRPRVVRTPRYDAMEAHFDSRGPAGRTMMRSTAALQVNTGLRDAPAARWEASHALGPVLAAAFANSPFGDARPSGWRSTRLAVWGSIEGARGPTVAPGSDCRVAWATYALSAPLMLVRASESEHVPMRARLSFGEWIARGHDLGWPTADDLAYHLTTLFPPVRPRGWLELRMIDALPSPWWRVAAAVTTVLVDAWSEEPALSRCVAPIRDRWDCAARDGLSDPKLAAAATTCFDIARAQLIDAGADQETLAATDAYVDRYVARRRCPADDLIDRWHQCGALVPLPDNQPEPAWA